MTRGFTCPLKTCPPCRPNPSRAIYAYACARGRYYYMDRWLYPCARLCTQQMDSGIRSIIRSVDPAISWIGALHLLQLPAAYVHDDAQGRPGVRSVQVPPARASFCMRACVGVWNPAAKDDDAHLSPSDMHACTTLSSYLTQLLTTTKTNY